MVVEVIGWIGAAAVLAAYFFVSIGKLSGKSRQFQALNVLGAVGIIINAASHGAVPSVGLNIVWLLIAVYELIKLAKKKKRTIS